MDDWNDEGFAVEAELAEAWIEADAKFCLSAFF